MAFRTLLFIYNRLDTRYQINICCALYTMLYCRILTWKASSPSFQESITKEKTLNQSQNPHIIQGIFLFQRRLEVLGRLYKARNSPKTLHNMVSGPKIL